MNHPVSGYSMSKQTPRYTSDTNRSPSSTGFEIPSILMMPIITPILMIKSQSIPLEHMIKNGIDCDFIINNGNYLLDIIPLLYDECYQFHDESYLSYLIPLHNQATKAPQELLRVPQSSALAAIGSGPWPWEVEVSGWETHRTKWIKWWWMDQVIYHYPIFMIFIIP